jgi:hypothetical protein
MNWKLIIVIILNFIFWFVMITLVFGCQQTTLRPLHDHIYFVPKGVEIQTTNYGTVTTKHEGIWMSEFYLNEMWSAELPEK